MRKLLMSVVAAAGLVALSSQANAAGPVTAKYYSGFQELPGVGILIDNGSLFATSQISSINNYSDPNPAAFNTDPNFPNANMTFAADFSSDITVASAGTYTFSFTTDDAGYFSVDDQTASLPGNHAAETGTLTLALSAGVHTLELTMDNTAACCAQATVVLADGVTYGDPAVAISAAPEPGAWALMLGGVGMLGAFLRIQQARRREDAVGDIATA